MPEKYKFIMKNGVFIVPVTVLNLQLMMASSICYSTIEKCVGFYDKPQ